MANGICTETFDLNPMHTTVKFDSRSCVILVAVTWQAGLGILAGKAGKRLWMSEYSSGPFEVTDIRTGLALSLQACFLL